MEQSSPRGGSDHSAKKKKKAKQAKSKEPGCVESTCTWLCFALGAAIFLLVCGVLSAVFGKTLRSVRVLGWKGVLLYCLVYFCSTIIILPGSGTILNMGAGWLYGPFTGAFIAIGSGTVGAIGSFMLGRYCLKDCVRRRWGDNKIFMRACAAIENGGPSQTTKIVVLLRLPPLFPFAVINYCLSLTDVDLGVFTLATAFGVVPACTLDAYIGSLFVDLSGIIDGDEPANAAATRAKLVALIAELVVTVVVTIVLHRKAKAAYEATAVLPSDGNDEMVGLLQPKALFETSTLKDNEIPPRGHRNYSQAEVVSVADADEGVQLDSYAAKNMDLGDMEDGFA